MILVKLIVAAGLLVGFLVYIGYPLFCFGAGLFSGTGSFRVSERQRLKEHGRVPRSGDTAMPFVSIIISTKDEATRIETKLENTLALEYPANRLEIIVAVNGSTDGTESLAGGYAGKGVRCVISKKAGKTRAQNLAVPETKGDLIFFTDADILLEPGSLRHLAAEFADPDVGAAHGSIRFRGGGSRSLYWDYEYLLKKLESETGRCLTALGGIFLIRRSVWRPIDPSIMEDFALPVWVLAEGYKSVFVQNAVGHTRFYPDRTAWIESIHRIAVQDMFGYTAAVRWLSVRNRWGLLAMLTIRKPMRWLGLVYILPVQCGLVLMAPEGGMQLVAGIVAAAAAGWGAFGVAAGRSNPVSSFYIMHAAALRGVIDFFRGERLSWWNRREPGK